MPSTQIYIDQTLDAQQAALHKLADEYCESGNQFVISASLWVRPIIIDFINIVKERHRILKSCVEQQLLINERVILAVDFLLDNSIELIVSAYPLTSRAYVRSITSRIRNDLAIARLNARAQVERKLKSKHQDPRPLETGINEIINADTMNHEQFKMYCTRDYQDRMLAAYIVLSSPLFNSVSLSCIKNRVRVRDNSMSRLSDLTEKKFFTERDEKTISKNENYETFFDAFRRFWKSLPYGNLFLALAIKKLMQTPILLKKIIRYPVDIKELLFICLPTIAMRKAVLQSMLKNNYLSLTVATPIFPLLPEGRLINWYIDMAELGVEKYISLSAKKFGDKWLGSKKKSKADVYAQLLNKYRHEAVLEKKIIIFILLKNERKSLPKLVCKAMGSPNVAQSMQLLQDSIAHDADFLKIDMNVINQAIIDPIINNLNAGKTLASGDYDVILETLHVLVPHYDVVKSSF